MSQGRNHEAMPEDQATVQKRGFNIINVLAGASTYLPPFMNAIKIKFIALSITTVTYIAGEDRRTQNVSKVK